MARSWLCRPSRSSRSDGAAVVAARDRDVPLHSPARSSRQGKTVVRRRNHGRLPLGESTSEANLLAAGVRARNRIGPVCRCTITGVKPCSPRDSRFASRTDRQAAQSKRCWISSGPAVSSRSPQAFATPGRAAVERPDLPTAVVVAPDEVGAPRVGCATALHSNGSPVFVGVRAGADRYGTVSSRRRAWVDGAGELRGRLAWTTVRLGR